LQWDRAWRGGGGHSLTTALDERSLLDVEPGAWSPVAVAVATAAFAAGHPMAQWPAATGYGLLMAWLWVVRRDLVSCMVAHGVTNVALGLFAWATGLWRFW
jgi:hypothetical protein